MIRTKTEYEAAIARLEKDREFLANQRAALRALKLEEGAVEHAMQPAMSFHEQLKEEVETYERIVRGDIRPIEALTDIGRLLIALRIASGISQRDLAARLGVPETSVSRDERNEYQGISIERAQRVLDALERKVRIEPEPEDVQVNPQAERAAVA
jgi:DNA-binding XRE family transcriptional regulator